MPKMAMNGGIGENWVEPEIYLAKADAMQTGAPLVASAAADEDDGSTKRPSEVQDWLNEYIYHPLARRLAEALVPTGITPNMVSICGLMLIIAATLAYVGLPYPVSVAIGLFLHLSWHVVDGADGHLARITGKSSPIGELVDGMCDYLGHIFLYIVLCIVYQPRDGAMIWLLAALAGVSHAVQTNHAETQKRTYLWWAYGLTWLKQKSVDSSESHDQHWLARFFGIFSHAYVYIANAMNPGADAVDQALHRADGDAAWQKRMRMEVRSQGRRMLFPSKLVGPNPRAYLLGFAMLMGDAKWFFWLEIVLLNLLLLYSLYRQRQDNQALAARLSAVS